MSDVNFFLTVLIIGILSPILFMGKRSRLYRINHDADGEAVLYEKKPTAKEALDVFLRRFSKDKTAALLHHMIVSGFLLMIIGYLSKPFLGGGFWATVVIPNLVAFGKVMIFLAIS